MATVRGNTTITCYSLFANTVNKGSVYTLNDGGKQRALSLKQDVDKRKQQSVLRQGSYIST